MMLEIRRQARDSQLGASDWTYLEYEVHGNVL